MAYDNPRTHMRITLAVVVLAFGMLLGVDVSAQVPAPTTAPPAAAPAAPPPQAVSPAAKRPPVPGTAVRPVPNQIPRRAKRYYQGMWGIDSLNVKWAESGELIRFSYRVVNAEKAEKLNDKKYEPSLIDVQRGVKLVVPSLEKVGQLRQSSPPIAGKIYWMAFSNKGRVVKRGDHVDLVIGDFRAEGLVVE